MKTILFPSQELKKENEKRKGGGGGGRVAPLYLGKSQRMVLAFIQQDVHTGGALYFGFGS